MGDETVGEKHVRKQRKGEVISRSGDKTVVVRVEGRRRHPQYTKVVRFSRKFHCHDEKNATAVGDLVKIVECRPLSRLKRWRVTEVIRRGEAAGKVEGA